MAVHNFASWLSTQLHRNMMGKSCSFHIFPPIDKFSTNVCMKMSADRPRLGEAIVSWNVIRWDRSSVKVPNDLDMLKWSVKLLFYGVLINVFLHCTLFYSFSAKKRDLPFGILQSPFFIRPYPCFEVTYHLIRFIFRIFIFSVTVSSLHLL